MFKNLSINASQEEYDQVRREDGIFLHSNKKLPTALSHGHGVMAIVVELLLIN